MTTQEKNERLLEQIVAHFTDRLRAGRPPSINAYQRKHPHLKDEIKEILSSVAIIEELKQATDAEPAMRQKSIDELWFDKIGDYRIIRELGRGGMGVVYEAVHESLERKVAIKVMPENSTQNRKHLERFRREAQAAANLHHTNIVSVFGSGQHEGHQYYVMEFIDGKNLSLVIRELSSSPSSASPSHPSKNDTADNASPSTIAQWNRRQEKTQSPSNIQSQDKPNTPRWRWAAKLGVQISDALTHAHQHGILHRDIKPANLMLDKNNVAWVTDFGLVKNSLHQTLTQTGDVVGTPQYMAPESFEGNYDSRSETYCLGLTLYELVTLRPAFQEKTTHELIRKITTTTPEAPRKINPAIPRDLNTIIEKSIQREPADRYESAEELRNDLRALLSDQPIHARRSDPLEQTLRWTRRNPLLASLLTASILSICLVAITANLSYNATQNAFRQLSLENKKLVIAESQITAKEQLANRNYEQMKQQFDRAEKNVAITLEMLDQMFDHMLVKDATPESNIEIDGFEDLSELTTSVTSEDAQFLERLLVFYARFTAQNIDNTDLVYETANAYRRVANIYQLIGEAQRATPAYQEAIAIYQRLLNETEPVDEPGTLELTLAIARTRNDWAMLQAKTREYTDSEAKLKTTILTLEAFETSNPEVTHELAKTLYQLASTPTKNNLSDRHRNPRRGPSHRGRRLVGLPPEGLKPIKLNGRLPEDKRRRDFERQRSERSRYKYDCAVRAASLLETLVQSNPNRTDYQLDHAKSLLQIANSEFKTASQQKDIFAQAQSTLKKLSQRNQDNPEYDYVLGSFYLQRSKNPDGESLKNTEQAKQIGQSLFQTHPDHIRYRQLYAKACHQLGRLYHLSGDFANSRKNQEIALSMWSDLSGETDDIRYFFQKNSHQLELARESLRLEKYSDAKFLVEQSIQELESSKIYGLAKQHAKRFSHRTTPTSLKPNGPPGQRHSIRMSEDEFWSQYKNRLLDHYSLLSNVTQQQGDTASATEATNKGSEIAKMAFPKEFTPRRQ